MHKISVNSNIFLFLDKCILIKKNKNNHNSFSIVQVTDKNENDEMIKMFSFNNK